MIDKIKNNPVISILILCVTVISSTAGVTSWFYEKQITHIVSKYETEKATTKNSYEARIKILELDIAQLKNSKSPTKSSLPNNVEQKTEGAQSPAVISGGDTDITINE